nr:hypothetical protein [Marinobacter sp. 1-4A]
MSRAVSVATIETQLQLIVGNRRRIIHPVTINRPVPGRRRKGFVHRPGRRCPQQQAAEQHRGFGFSLAAADLGNRHPDVECFVPDDAIDMIHGYCSLQGVLADNPASAFLATSMKGL